MHMWRLDVYVQVRLVQAHEHGALLQESYFLDRSTCLAPARASCAYGLHVLTCFFKNNV